MSSTTFMAYRAAPDGPARGGIVLLPGDEAIADRLAAEGYVVLAPQGDQAASGLRRLVDALAADRGVDGRIAVLGSGPEGDAGYALATDRRVRLVVSFDTDPGDVDEVADIRANVAAFFAADSPTVAVLPELRAAMRRAGVRFTARVYPDVTASFFGDPASDGVADDSWHRSLALLAANLA
ncbi:dienelactone hydrolase family protein [Calidifontibacter sp. DB0510]|uniref:Dienelactone hydrolase family protein n=1 Tax=Metallococcus carri TaxID=1656884 RepID=A0A967EBN6_9MICO|nr:dienelactone hydrolase family protein [Metallococcus carri]NHN57154.1 dienelactone hydrolase family protein [Metallococcus carri]NOP38043.1 hypothetical protein [Calidifontibacter sp. DB2511S]